MNVVELTGRISQDIKLFTTNGGTSVATLNIAVKPDFVKKGDEPKPEFIPVTVWSSLADVCAENLCKGYLVGITGRLQRRTYDTAEGEHRYVTEVIADKVEFLSKPKEAEAAPAEAKKSKSKKAS
ncbi:single-stranded DNA-binding protein [Selenomonas sp. KH1T6]|uniref:single-stranded DNA-binding protein n=1 Tax=Selenomonas sp. KH1T6 TaxID=3158784 RepID=UPI0008A7A494|nr:single-strand binding protein [Selenomonas ruminantium]